MQECCANSHWGQCLCDGACAFCLCLFEPVQVIWVHSRKAHVVTARSSIAWRTHGTRNTYFIWGFTNPVPLWRIVAHQVCCPLPYGAPNIHIMASINGTSYFIWRCPHHLCVMSAHWPIALKGTSGIAVSRIWKRIVLHFIMPGFHKLQNGSIPSCSDWKVLTQKSKKIARTMFPNTSGCPLLSRLCKSIIPDHIFHVWGWGENFPSNFIMVIKDSKHIVLWNITFPSGFGNVCGLCEIFWGRKANISQIGCWQRWGGSGTEACQCTCSTGYTQEQNVNSQAVFIHDWWLRCGERFLFLLQSLPSQRC